MNDTLHAEPLGPHNRKDLENLFGPRGGCGGCWCMNMRCLKQDFESGKTGGNFRNFVRRIDAGQFHGLILYAEEAPVGWISIGPKSEFPRMQVSRMMRTQTPGNAWCITCQLIRPDYRGQYLSDVLVNKAVEYAFDCGADWVEAFPSDPGANRLPPPFIWQGVPGPYLRNGFEVVSQPSPSRKVLRRFPD